MLRWKKRLEQHREVLQRVEESDLLLREVADVVIELRVNAERLEQALQKLKEEENG